MAGPPTGGWRRVEGGRQSVPHHGPLAHHPRDLAGVSTSLARGLNSSTPPRGNDSEETAAGGGVELGSKPLPRRPPVKIAGADVELGAIPDRLETIEIPWWVLRRRCVRSIRTRYLRRRREHRQDLHRRRLHSDREALDVGHDDAEVPAKLTTPQSCRAERKVFIKFIIILITVFALLSTNVTKYYFYCCNFSTIGASLPEPPLDKRLEPPGSGPPALKPALRAPNLSQPVSAHPASVGGVRVGFGGVRIPFQIRGPAPRLPTRPDKTRPRGRGQGGYQASRVGESIKPGPDVTRRASSPGVPARLRERSPRLAELDAVARPGECQCQYCEACASGWHERCALCRDRGLPSVEAHLYAPCQCMLDNCSACFHNDHAACELCTGPARVCECERVHCEACVTGLHELCGTCVDRGVPPEGQDHLYPCQCLIALQEAYDHSARGGCARCSPGGAPSTRRRNAAARPRGGRLLGNTRRGERHARPWGPGTWAGHGILRYGRGPGVYSGPGPTCITYRNALCRAAFTRV